MKRLIDCFTFNNEFDMLELRLKEISSVVDKFILVEANSTFKGDSKPFYFDENKEKYKEWEDKIIHVKCIIPESITDVWSRERYQRNSFMSSLYYLGLSDNDLVMITDVDEIPNVDTIGYIKNGYPHDMKGLYKLEMDVYCASLYNKCTHIKWYHPKIVDWETLKSKTPDSCRLDFNCQWWENGGWHLTYFGGVDKIVNKIDSFSHQELNLPEFKVADRIIQKVRDGEDMFDLNSTTELINPYDNKNLPKNWKLLEKFESSYRNHKERKNLVLCNLNESNNESIISFVNSFREFNNEDDFYLITDSLSRYNSLSSLLHGRNVNFIFSSFGSLINSNVYRFYKYLDFITENDSYNKIMLINTDDYIFSDNPFDIKADDEFIIFSEESENLLIKNNTTSSDLFSLTFGEDLQDKIGNYQGLSSDIVIGSYKNIVNYLVKMTEIISNRIIINPEIVHERIDNSVNNFVARLDSDDLKNKEFKKLEIDIETNTNNPLITEKDLVICAAIGLDTDSIKNFIKSFRKHNKDADIFCIIESESSINKINFLKSNGVKLLFSDSIKFTRTQPNNTRFMKIADFLKETDKKYRNVLLSDIVDVVFQSDPFLNLTGEFIISPEEDEEKTIEKDQRFNARWLKQCFGDNLYEELKHNKILCCGTVIGSINNMKVYVDSICNEMFKLYENGSGHFQDMMDQGIHNYLFYKTPEIFKNPIIKRNGDYIATVGITVIEHPHKVEYLGDKIKVNGLIPSIVHQYNRSNDMINLYNRLHMEDHQIITNTIDSGSLNNTTIVTALYDLNRESWDGFNRKFDTYKGWMAHMLSFDSPMVIYVDPSDVDFVSNNRRGKEDITRIVPLPFTQLSTYKKYGERIREVMGSESFLLNQTVPEHPQIKFPDYNILMHQKIQFVNDASIINYFNTDYFMWLDAGVYHMNNREDLLGKKFPTINLSEEKMYFLHIDEPKESDLDLERFYKGHNVRIIGTSWLGHKNAINKFTLEYENLIEESLSKNLMDQDQSFFTVCYLRNKHICDTNQGTWKSAIDFWG